MWGQSEVQEVWGSEENARERLQNLCEVKELNYFLVFTRIKTWHRPLASLWICNDRFSEVFIYWNIPRKLPEMAFPRAKIWKFSGGACPQIPQRGALPALKIVPSCVQLQICYSYVPAALAKLCFSKCDRGHTIFVFICALYNSISAVAIVPIPGPCTHTRHANKMIYVR